MGFIKDGFDLTNLKTNMLVTALKDEKKDHLITFIKSAGIIKKLVNKKLYLFLNSKTVQEI